MRDALNPRTPVHHGFHAGIRPGCNRLGPGGQKAAIAAAKLGKTAAVVESGNCSVACASTPARFRRRHCGRPSCISRGSPNANSTARATASKTTSRRTTSGPHPSRRHQRDRSRRISWSQPGAVVAGIGSFHRRTHRRRRSSRRGETRSRCREIHRDRGRHQAAPAGGRRVRRPTGGRLRRHPRPEVDPRVNGRRRCRRHRHRVRIHVRRARHQGHRRREANDDARVLRRRSSRHCVSPARSGRDVPVPRRGHRGRVGAGARSPCSTVASRYWPTR